MEERFERKRKRGQYVEVRLVKGTRQDRMMKGPFEGQMGIKFPNQYHPRVFYY